MLQKAVDKYYLKEDLADLCCILCGKVIEWVFDHEECGEAECCNRAYRTYPTHRVYSYNADNV